VAWTWGTRRSRRPAGGLGLLVGILVVGFCGLRGLGGETDTPQRPSPEGAPGPYAAWRNGPGRLADDFPLAVWLQAPRNAGRYQALGINLYVGLWRGPTEEQVAELKRHGMPVICALNDYARAHLDEPTFVGWMHGDEPDNARPLGRGRGYGPPVPPAEVEADYARIQAADPTRPVLLNLGQGVAWDGWRGRGVRAHHPEDYPQYVRGCDIASFDIYPAVHAAPEVAGRLWYVARGVDRFRRWAGGRKVVWNCIECTRIGNPDVKPTPEQVKAEVWMAIVHGSRGDRLLLPPVPAPVGRGRGLLADEAMARAVAGINRQVRELTPAILSPAVDGAVEVETAPADVSPELGRSLRTGPVAVAVRRHGGATYVFAVRLESSPVQATFRARGQPDMARVEILGEGRTLPSRGGAFRDGFAAHAAHLYRIGP
jgi:hypothetical protein